MCQQKIPVIPINRNKLTLIPTIPIKKNGNDNKTGFSQIEIKCNYFSFIPNLYLIYELYFVSFNILFYLKFVIVIVTAKLQTRSELITEYISYLLEM